MQINIMTSDWRMPLLLITLLLNACASTATQNTVCHGQRVTIQFMSGIDVEYPGFNAGLARDAGVPLDYMRHLFDDYYLYCARPEGQASLLDEVLERLQGRPDIRTAEPDRIKGPQRKE